MKIPARRIVTATAAAFALGLAGLSAGPAQAADGTITVTFTGPASAAIDGAAQLCMDAYDTGEDRNFLSGVCAGTPGDSTLTLNVSPGDYTLNFFDSASPEHYASQWYDGADYSAAQTVTIGSGETLTPAVELAELGTVSGSVPQNSPETPICITAYDASTPGPDGYARRDCPDTEDIPATSWTLALPPGSYKIRYSQQQDTGFELAADWNGGVAKESDSAAVPIAIDTPVALGAHNLPDAAEAYGHVEGPGGATPVGYVSAEAKDSDGFYYTSTSTEVGPDGNYRLEGLNPNATYTVDFYSDYFEIQWYNGKSNEQDANPLAGLAVGTPLNLGNTTLSYDTSLAPTAPRSARAIAGNTSTQLVWDPPQNSDVTAPITYTATASNGRTCSTTGLNCTITGLTNDTAYSFSVTARNVIGTGPASNAVSATPTGANQNGPKVVSKVKVGRTAKLPRTTASGAKISWKSKTKRTCTVKGNTVKGKKTGKCKVQALAPKTDTLNSFSAVYPIKIK